MYRAVAHHSYLLSQQMPSDSDYVLELQNSKPSHAAQGPPKPHTLC